MSIFEGKQMRQSGAAQDGFLSSTDWNTFNNKKDRAPVSVPSSSTDSGTQGDWAWDGTRYIYECVATDTWTRHAVVTSW